MILPDNWNQNIIERGGHVLHSSQWANFQASIGRQPYFAISDDWYWIGFLRQASGLRYMAAAHNPQIQTEAINAVNSMLVSGTDSKCDFIRIEPTGKITESDLAQLNAIKIADVQPSATLVLDLTQSEDELRAGLQSGHRNRINTSEKRGISIECTTDLRVLPDFLRLMHDTAKYAHITNHPDWYFQKMAKNLVEQGVAKFYVARVENTPASISMIYDWGGTRYYAHTGNDQILNRQYKAAVSNVWQMILDAKESGLKQFDFWGIAPNDDPKHKWAGITGFKKGFGGVEVINLGTYDIPIHSSKYKMYQVYQRVRGRK